MIPAQSEGAHQRELGEFKTVLAELSEQRFEAARRAVASDRCRQVIVATALWLAGAWVVSRLVDGMLWDQLSRSGLGRAVPRLMRGLTGQGNDAVLDREFQPVAALPVAQKLDDDPR